MNTEGLSELPEMANGGTENMTSRDLSDEVRHPIETKTQGPVWELPDISHGKTPENLATWKELPAAPTDLPQKRTESEWKDDFWGDNDADLNDLQAADSSETTKNPPNDIMSGESVRNDISSTDELDSVSNSLKDCGDASETDIKDFDVFDDNGVAFKDDDGNLRPNTEFEVNGNHYKTDEQGRVTSWEANLRNNPEERDSSANAIQQEAGGEDRLENDDGGHLVAHMNGGSSGSENVVPMRGHLNKGDYKRGENDENQMLQDGKEVHESGQVNYEGDSKRPSTIEKTYTDGEKIVDAKYDNREGSTELLDDVKEDISKEDYQSLTDEISDMKGDKHDVSVTSVEKHYDSEGKLTKVTVGVRDETTGDKEYKNYSPEQKGSENAAA